MTAIFFYISFVFYIIILVFSFLSFVNFVSFVNWLFSQTFLIDPCKLWLSEIGQISLRAGSDTEAMFDASGRYSCVVSVGESVLFFGGWKLNQISQLTSRGLRRVGTLPFLLSRGTCIVQDDKLFVGFGLFNENLCSARWKIKKKLYLTIIQSTEILFHLTRRRTNRNILCYPVGALLCRFAQSEITAVLFY